MVARNERMNMNEWMHECSVNDCNVTQQTTNKHKFVLTEKDQINLKNLKLTKYKFTNKNNDNKNKWERKRAKYMEALTRKG